MGSAVRRVAARGYAALKTGSQASVLYPDIWRLRTLAAGKKDVTKLQHSFHAGVAFAG
jgi:hypothetical protein